MSAAHAYAPHQGNIFPPHPSDLAHNYQFAPGRAPFDQQLPFDGAAGSNVPAWLYDGTHASASQNVTGNGLTYHIDTYGSHTSAAASGSIAAASGASINADTQHHASGTGPPTARFASKAAAPADAVPFAVIPDSAAPHSLPGSLHSLVSAVPHTMADRRLSDESAHAVGAGPSMSDTGSSAAALPPRGTTKSTSESAGFSGSISPTSSARMSGSPEVISVAQSFPSYTPATVPPMGGMVMGAPVTASMMESIDSWLAPASSASLPSTAGLDTLATAMGPAKAVMAPANKPAATEPIAPSDVPSSSRLPGGPAFHPGPSTNSSASMIDGVPFKTSIERRERNKASQRESRKRKQDRLETLEGENAALRKALADMKKFSQALSNGAGIRSEDGTEVAPAQLAKFTGAFHLDLIESHLDDESQEAEWKGMIGRRFPTKSTQVDDITDGDAGVPALSTSDSDEDSNREEPHELADNAQGSSSLKREREGAPPSASQQVKKAMWEISLNQKRQKAAQSFPSMVAVPELVLYKVCRLYFSTLLPFTTKLKSGIVNLRAAREAPGFIGGLEDLPRFPGDPSFGSSDLYLPKNLMPTEMQMRLGFHPIEIAVMPYPLMRDRMLTVLSAFQAIEELQQEEEDEAAGRISEDSSIRGPAADKASSRQQTAHSDELEAEVVDGDIRQRTALVADMSAWKPKDFSGAVVMPDKGRVYSYGFLEKPRGSHRLRKPAQRWLDQFFYEVVQTLRVWSPAGDVFDGECFEFKESFFRKYPYMVDGEILKATNRWRRARGEDPIRL